MTKKIAPSRAPRADARRNHAHLLEIAHEVVTEAGTNASLRDVARRAGVGLATLYRHFPTRDALLEALLRHRFDTIARLADDLTATGDPLAALTTWLRELAAGAATYRDLSSTMLSTMMDETSPLHASCTAMRTGGARLLARAQKEGSVRPDIDSIDLFALTSAVAWAADQSAAMASRKEHLLTLLLRALEPRETARRTRRKAKP